MMHPQKLLEIFRALRNSPLVSDKGKKTAAIRIGLAKGPVS